MAGGLGVTALGFNFASSLENVFSRFRIDLPLSKRIDVPLIGGAALFGVGWGLAGIVPARR